MISELEKQFFDTFGIETIKRRTCSNAGDCPDGCIVCDTCMHWHIRREDYPQITDHILLGLICVANQHENYPISTNIKNIQARTLRILLRTEKLYKKYHGSDGRYKKLVKQVCKLFKENSNG